MLKNFLWLFDPRGVFEPISVVDVVVLCWTIMFIGFFFYAMSRPIL